MIILDSAFSPHDSFCLTSAMSLDILWNMSRSRLHEMVEVFFSRACCAELACINLKILPQDDGWIVQSFVVYNVRIRI